MNSTMLVLNLIPFVLVVVLLAAMMYAWRGNSRAATRLSGVLLGGSGNHVQAGAPAQAPRALRGIRGATTVTEDTQSAILEATEELVRDIVAANALAPEDVASALFTVTPDLHAEFPAAAARRMGWTLVPLLNFTEIGVPGRLPRCIRVLIHVNTEKAQAEMVHVYLREAVSLRPDLVSRSTTPQ